MQGKAHVASVSVVQPAALYGGVGLDSLAAWEGMRGACEIVQDARFLCLQNPKICLNHSENPTGRISIV